MERSPPPLFNQGPSTHARLLFYAALSVALLFIDARYQALSVLRQTVGTILYPAQQAALWPRQAVRAVDDYFASQTVLQKENEQFRQERLLGAQALQGQQQLAAENAQLRSLLDLRQRMTSPGLVAEILYDARDPYVRKVVLDKGLKHNVQLGQPVIDAEGVVGQVIRVFPLTAEVSLLTDRDQTIPVQIVRNGLRAIAFGGAEPQTLELRFMAANADIQNGDVLVTSGLDGVYPPGLAVGRVIRIERNAASSFARVVSAPLGGIDRYSHYLILQWQASLPPKPEPAPAASGSKKKSSQ
jgi:rod shape-determining protein MreC